MANKRIKDLATTATTTASDDFMAVDGVTNGTRKLSAATPAFLTSVTTPSLTSPASTNLTLGTTDSGAAITVATTNKVGIGTTAPGLYDGEGNDLVVFRAATAGITIAVSDTSSRTSIKFADGTTGSEAYRGGIEYDHGTGLGTADSLHFRTAAALRMAINGSGNVLIGTTSNTGLTGAGGLSIASTTAGASNAGALLLQGGVSAGNTGSAASYFGGAVTVATGNLIIGTAGNGIDFSATAGTGTSELLNDYEEGTWTPTDNSGAGLSFTVYSATYTKIGRLVEVEAAIYFPATANTDAVQITGLPFTAAGGDDNTGGLSISATNVGANYYMLITRGSSTFTINTNADASVTNVTYSGKVLKFFGWYHV